MSSTASPDLATRPRPTAEVDAPIVLFDTLACEKRALETIEPGRVKMYVCGLTVYDYAHIGHARTFIVFDVVRRYLEHRGYEVIFVRNHTDVDDKIIRRAKEVDEEPLALAARFIEAFDRDMEALNLCPPDVAPRVSLEIPAIIDMVSRLVARGHAYAVEGNVFFEVSTFPDYGKLSRKKLDDLRAGERVGVDVRKRDPADFALWKAAKPGEPAWDSPWGPGRPGWHIECSAMSSRYLGQTFDIHGGGRDLIFPHHENEIAQSEAASGCSFARYWMHIGPLQIDGEKMSKSLDNFWLVRDALERHHPDVIRFFMLTGHYRKPVNYTLECLDDACRRVLYYYKSLRALERVLEISPPVEARGKVREVGCLTAFWRDFHAAMDDDFNTPRALAIMNELAKAANDLLPKRERPLKDPVLTRTLRRAHDDLRAAGEILGLFSQPAKEALLRIRELRAGQKGIDVATVERLIAERIGARSQRDWEKADQIRQQLAEMGVAVMDGAQGTTWEMH